MTKLQCYSCRYRRDIPGDQHSQCMNMNARVEGKTNGISMGWFFWPFNFDPVWLISCDGHEPVTNAEKAIP